jgi:chemotaxis protein methyltransferase CheR
MNALKHAFPEEKKDAAIVVSYKVSGPDWKLTISDNGIGKPDVSGEPIKPGLGTSLVQSLAKQLEGVVDIKNDSQGRAVTITHATFRANTADNSNKAAVAA